MSLRSRDRGRGSIDNVPSVTSVALTPVNPNEGDELLSTPSSFAQSDSFSHDFRVNSSSYAEVYYPCAGGATNALEDKSTNLNILSNIGGVVFSATGGPTASIPSYWDFPAASSDLRSFGYNGIAVDSAVGVISVAMWVRMPVVSGVRTLVGWGTALDNQDFSVRVSNVGIIEVRFDGSTVAFSSTGIVTNAWTHIAVIYTGGNANTSKIYLDGVLSTTASTSKPLPIVGTSNNVRWGLSLSGTFDYEGDMTDMRLYEDELSPSQITLLANGEIDKWVDTSVPRPPSDDALILHWKLDETSGTAIADSSGKGNTGTMVNFNAGAASIPGKVDTSIDFDRVSTDYIQTAPTLASDPTGPMTVMFWAYHESDGAGGFPWDIGAQYDGAGGFGWDHFEYQLSGTDTSVYCGINTAGNGRFSNSDTPGFVDFNQWQHVCFIIDENLEGYLYKNGKLFVQKTFNQFADPTWGGFRVGTATGNNGPNGRVDDLRIYNRAITPSELRAVYSFQAPILIASLDDDVVSTVVIDSSKRSDTNDGIIVGGKTADQMTQTGIVNKAMLFDGTNDEVKFTNAGNRFDVTTGVTASCWIKTPGITVDSGNILIKSNTISLRKRETEQKIQWIVTGPSPSFVNGSILIDDDEWHHVVGIYDGAAMAIYIDGVLDISVASTGLINIDSLQDLFVGANNINTEEYNGLIDDVRIFDVGLTQTQIQELYNTTKSNVFGYDATCQSMGFDSNEVVIASAPLWTPNEITTSVWLDASDLTTLPDGLGATSTWNDKSGNGIVMSQSTAALKPVLTANKLNGLSGLVADGSDLMSGTVSIPANQDLHFFYVQDKNTDATAYDLTGAALTNLRMFDNSSRVGRERGGSADFPPVSDGLLLTPNLYYANHLNSQVGIGPQMHRYENGSTTALFSQNLSSSGFIAGDIFDTLYLFDDSTGNNELTRTQYELIIVNNDTDRDKIEGYLSWKWGLESLLPSGHAYKNSPPLS